MAAPGPCASAPGKSSGTVIRPSRSSSPTTRFDATQTLLHQATHDELTGLPNRSALQQRLRELRAAGQPFALLLLDVDRFKLFNEAHGPSVGDDVLRALAAGLTETLASGPASAPR